MTVEPDIIFKEARVRARREPERRERYLDGAVSLLRFRRDAHHGLQAARIVDVAKTVDSAIDALSDFVVEAVATGDAELGRELDDLAAKVGDLTRRLELVERDNATLRTVNEGFVQELELLGRLNRESTAPKAKRKAKANPDANLLPDFVRAAPAKRKPRIATIEAASP